MGAIDVWNRAYRAMRNAGVPGLHEDDRISSAAYVIQTALDEARAEERRAIVDWLRNDASAAWGASCDDLEEMSWCIEAVERGDHLPTDSR
jgi:hypothetical protein